MPLTKTVRTVSLLIVGAGLAFNGYSQSFLTNGLVAYYPFNGNANDASGNGVNGSVQGAVLTTNRFGNPNGAYYFNGTSSYITAPLSNAVFSGDFTASLWFNAFDIAHRDPSLLDEENLGFRLQIASDDCNCGRQGRLVSYSSYTTPPLHTSSWLVSPPQRTPVNAFQQVVVTKAGTSIKIYVNGQLADTNQAINPTTPSGQYLLIGRLYDWTDLGFFLGVIDDIRIYNRALSSNEVSELYATESGPRVDLIKAVKPSFSYLWVGTNYQLQLSADMNTWTNHGSPFTATNTSMVYPQYWDVENWGTLFFRLRTSP